MNYCQTSLNAFKKLIRALTDADLPAAEELRRIVDENANGLTISPQMTSSTAMALGQLGLIDRVEAGNNLSV